MSNEIEEAQRRLIEKYEAGICIECGHPLTDPAKSPNGWAWCRNPVCRHPFQILKPNGKKVVITMDGEIGAADPIVASLRPGSSP